jgi:hypothetical protein
VEDKLFNAESLQDLYTMIIKYDEEIRQSPGPINAFERLRWRHAYFFFRGLRHLQTNKLLGNVTDETK